MNKQITSIIIFCISLLVSCNGTGTPDSMQEKNTPTKTVTSFIISSPTQKNTVTIINPVPSISTTLSTTGTPTIKQTSIPGITQTDQDNKTLNTKCLKVETLSSNNTTSNGIIVLGRRAGGDQRRYDTLILNMDSCEKTEITTPMEYHVDQVVSPDRKFMAYQRVIFDKPDTLPKYELVIADAFGNRLKTIPWEDKWMKIMEWTLDKRVLISYDKAYFTSDGQKIPISYIVFDPLTGKQELLQSDVPKFLNLYPVLLVHWQGLIYDPTLNQVIYPRLIPNSEDMYTFVLWDLLNGRLVTSLENIYQNSMYFKNTTPNTIWATDGSQFALTGIIPMTNENESVISEMYQVGRGGAIEQLTNLTSIAGIDVYSFSWSPDGKHIAIFIHDWYGSGNPRLAVVDVNTHTVTDYCIPVRREIYDDPIYDAPIWSPDGTQLIVVDETDQSRRVILVDIVKNYAVQIAENYDALGWMVAP